MKSIPSELLRDSCLLKTELSRDEWGKAVYEETTLENVCIQTGITAGENAVSEENVPFGVLYFDCEKSRPAGTEFFPLKQTAVIGETEFRVLSCQTFCCGGKAHHMKVRLGRK